MASWLPSDSSSDSSSSDSSSDSGVVLARQPVIARAKGRPKGKAVPDFAVAQASGDQPLEKDMLADLVRPVGDELSVELGRLAVRSGPSHLEYEVACKTRSCGRRAEDIAEGHRYASICLGQDSPICMSVGPTNLARFLRTPRRTLIRNTQFHAAACWVASRTLALSLASRHRFLHETGKHHIVALFTHFSYDETPPPLRCEDGPRRLTRKSARQAAGTAKVLQADLQIRIVAQNAGTSTYHSVIIDCPCPLGVIERGTASCLKQAGVNLSHIPQFEALRSLDPGPGQPELLSADFVCADRAGANSCAEDSRYSDAAPKSLRSRQPCFAHTTSTSQSRGFNSIADDITGLIAMSLLQKPAKGTDGLRICLRDTLLDSCLGVRDVAPPLPGESDRVHLAAVLDLCLPAPTEGARRKARLMVLLSADITLEEFYLRVPGFPGNGFTVMEWAAEASELMLPAAIPEFPRHRWVNTLLPLSGWALLFVHYILPRAGFKWLHGILMSKSLRDQPRDELAWTLSDDEAPPRCSGAGFCSA